MINSLFPGEIRTNQSSNSTGLDRVMGQNLGQNSGSGFYKGEITMVVNELIQEMMNHAEELAVESVELLPTGEYEPVRKHKKKRIQKKWVKTYGMKPVYKKKKCKKIDVTIPMMIEFCQKYNFPIPSDLAMMFGGK